MTLRVGFAGTPAFAALALEALLCAGFTIPRVLTRPDKPKGRGLRVDASPVKSLALAHGLAVGQPATLRLPAAAADLDAAKLDVLVVAAYGLILPQPVLQTPRHGCLNIHASLLPRWRGAAPIARAIEAGDSQTGVTIMRMDAGLDTGPIVATRPLAMAPRETAATLHDRLAPEGAALIVEVLRRLEVDGTIASVPQADAGATYAAKIGASEAEVDWDADAVLIDRRIRAFNPAPGAFSHLGGYRVKIWTAEPAFDVAPGALPGTVLRAGNDAVEVACGSGSLRILSLQPAGARRMSAAQALAGRLVAAGARFVAGADAPIESRGGSGL